MAEEFGYLENLVEKKRILTALSILEAEDLLHYCLGADGDVTPGPHFRKALKEEGVDLPDAYLVLKNGRIYNPPEPDIKTGEWKYRVEGYETGGKYLAIIFCFKEVDHAFLITVFSIESLRRKP